MAILGFNNDINTLERAVKERVFYVKEDGAFIPPPKPLPGHFHATLATSMEQFRKLLPRSAPLSRADFVNTFRGRKRAIYENAAADLLRKGFSVADSYVKVFVKYEKTDFTRKTDPVPRVISPRSPRYNVELGRFLRPLEERIFRSLAKLFGHPTVIKGMNAARSGRVLYQNWCAFRDPAALGIDAKRFDQHVSIDALTFEHLVYLSCFPRSKHRKRLAWLLRMQLHNVCTGYTADGRIKYRTDGGRMSGDMNTSLGNCILMCLMIHAYAAHCGIRIRLANNGDDCVIFMERGDLAAFMQGLDVWFTDMGFSMVAEEPCFTFEQLEFCQTHPVYVGPSHDDYLMVRHPKWAIAKDTMCVHGYDNARMFRGWLHAVGTGGLAMTGRVPVFQDFYRTYVRYGQLVRTVTDGQSWGVRQLAKGMDRGYGPVSAHTRASFYWAFGVTPDEQLVLEDFYGSRVIRSDLGEIFQYQKAMPL